MKRMWLIAALAGFLAVGCGAGMAKVKGRLVENGTPMSFPPTQIAVELTLLGEDGKPDRSKVYTAVVNEDGSFEVVASGGTLTPGTYQVGIIATGKYTDRLKRFAPPASPVRREVKPGSNELTIDVAKPEG